MYIYIYWFAYWEGWGRGPSHELKVCSFPLPGKLPPVDPPSTKFLSSLPPKVNSPILPHPHKVVIADSLRPAMGNCMSSAQVHVPQSNFDNNQDGTLFS